MCKCHFLDIDPIEKNDLRRYNTVRYRKIAERNAYEPLTNWFDAFERLNRCVGTREKTVVLLDEISWMGKFDAAFTGYLKVAWDNWFSKKPKLIFVLCGSVASWIDANILKSTGFVGRTTMNMVVRELSMRESAAFAAFLPLDQPVICAYRAMGEFLFVVFSL